MKKCKITHALILIGIAICISNTQIATAKDNKTTATQTVQISQSPLPHLTLEMKESLIEAASAGDLDEVRDLFETNELAPVLTNEHISNPIDYWKKISIDGSARDIMAAIAEVFSLPPVKNKNGDFIWPYLAKASLKNLSRQQQIDLFRLVGPKQASEMLKTGQYTYYEAKIGKDGTWHYFKKIKPTNGK